MTFCSILCETNSTSLELNFASKSLLLHGLPSVGQESSRNKLRDPNEARICDGSQPNLFCLAVDAG